ncbi:MAG: VWA domain-containing protein [Thiotrichaceae bacterium]|nr:VWA domain-containing protein [Thiotrichaceae bacterium]
MNIEFSALWVFFLFPLPLLALLLPVAQKQASQALQIPFFKGVQPSFSSVTQPTSITPLALAVLIWVLVLTATARPQLIGDSIPVPIAGRSLMIAVDISASMRHQDMQIGRRLVTRLVAVKSVAGDFITRRKGDRLGLILFGTQAFVQAPLTMDRKTVNILLDEAALGLAGSATSIGDAIGLSIKRLREQPLKNRVLILLTDGANTAGNVDPLKAADLAAQEKVRIYTIGIGGSKRLVRTPLGMRQVGGSDLDEPTLKEIASKTGGQYFRANDIESLQKIYAVLDKIEPVIKESLFYRPVDELYQWPLALALLLSLLLSLLFSGHIALPPPLQAKRNQNA